MIFVIFGTGEKVREGDNFSNCARPARSILFFIHCPAGKKNKTKKIPRVGGRWDRGCRILPPEKGNREIGNREETSKLAKEPVRREQFGGNSLEGAFGGNNSEGKLEESNTLYYIR